MVTSPAKIAIPPQEVELLTELQNNFAETIKEYNQAAEKKTCAGGCSDRWGKTFFHNTYVVFAINMYGAVAFLRISCCFDSVSGQSKRKDRLSPAW